MAKKQKPEKVDGLGEADIKKLIRAVRQVWAWSHARRLCVARATGADGFPRCEKCKKVAPKIQPDHIEPVGEWGPGYVERMFCPSRKLRALCKKCHQKKTNEENRARRERELDRRLGL